MARLIPIEVSHRPRKTLFPRRLFFILIAFACGRGPCFEAPPATVRPRAPLTTSLRLEIAAAISHGASFLKDSQNQRGAWGDNPCVTAMAVMAYSNASSPKPEEQSHTTQAKMADPFRPRVRDATLRQQSNRQAGPDPHDIIERALDYLAGCLQTDGSIATGKTARFDVLSTALCLQALASHGEKEKYRFAIHNSLAFLIKRQSKDGGFSPTSGGSSTLSTTLSVMEALYLCALNTPIEERDIAATLTRAGTYISSQSLKHNPPGPARLGDPSASRASQTAALARGLIYAGAKPDSKTLRETLTTLDKRFSVSENPGLGQRGYYTYLLSALKTLRICEQIGIDLTAYPHLKNWRNESARELMKRQTGFGQWRKALPDGGENNPACITAKVMFALVNILL